MNEVDMVATAGSGVESALDVSYSSLESENGRSISMSSDKFPPQVSWTIHILIICSLNVVTGMLWNAESINELNVDY